MTLYFFTCNGCSNDLHCSVSITDLVNFIVIGIFINKNTYIIPTNAYMTYRSVKDTDNVSRHFFLLKVHT